MTVFDEVKAERERQDAQWGGAEHDDEHGFQDWASFRQRFEERMNKVARKSPFDADEWFRVTRDSLIKVAALAIAQVESLDRNNSGVASPEGGSTT